MLGLGVGIDYALFIVTRHLALLRAGHEPDEAAARATATSGGAVLFAGSTVVVALLALYFSGIPIVRSLGYAAAIVVAVAIVAALTLLPALLGLLGRRIERGHVAFARGAHSDAHPRGWARWAAGVGRRPWPAALAGIVILVTLALPLRDITLGQPDNGQYPTDTEIRRSYDALKQGFSAGANGPLLIAVYFSEPAQPDRASLKQLQRQQRQQQQATQQQLQAEAEQQSEQAEAAGEPPPPPPQPPAPTKAQKRQQQQVNQQEQFLRTSASDPRLVKLQRKIGKTDDVTEVSPAKVDDSGSAAVFSATPRSAPSAQRTRDLVNELRDDVIPAAEGKGMRTRGCGPTSTARRRHTSTSPSGSERSCRW
jgi:uncharacterized membrane protein YdfJ with MMPL/SSD domain